MVATAYLQTSEPQRRSDQSRRLSELRDEAAKIRKEYQEGKISIEEAGERMARLAKRHRTFMTRILEL
jgi:hypothetical protein